MMAQSVTEHDEHEIVEWLFARSPVAGQIRQEFRVPADAIYGFRVCGPLLPAHGAQPGDVDVFACSPNRPDLATAFECKRVKVGSNAFATGLPTKLQSSVPQGAQYALRGRAGLISS